MKRYRFIPLVAVGFFLLGHGASVHAASHAEDLFQQALVKESGERDLEAAIELYKQVLQEPDAERLTRFEARIRMGSCYERLGKLKDAEAVYQQIVQEATTPQSEFAQEAQTNLRRLQNRERLVQQATTTIKPETMVQAVREFHETRWSGSFGLAALDSDGHELNKLALTLRYKLLTHALPVSVELGAFAPIGGSGVWSQDRTADVQTTDAGTLRLKYQLSLAVIKELPHGLERTVIPEAGVGLALTHADLEATSLYSGTTPSTVGDGRLAKNTWSPYFLLDLHFLPDHMVSYVLRATYSPTPYPESLAISPPEHTQTWDVPHALFGISALLQIKIGWHKIVLKRIS